jgi:beta-fructofuranosidase
MKLISRRTFLAQVGIAAAAAGFDRDACLFPEESEVKTRLASDPLRPQYHLLPAANWMNDPNGPIFYKGRYHMFFQYNPNGAFWGSMHWAHASSPDMVRWKHEPIALAPTPGGYDRDGVFSGSAVLDGETPTVIYTGVLPAVSPSQVTLDDGQHKWREVQCLATSRDTDLHTWYKLAEPIIAWPPKGLNITGFRDPGVWREGTDWLLTLGSGIRGQGGAVLLYRSSDLRHWAYLHPLIEGRGTGRQAANPVDNGEMWECPDFFPLADRHVLLFATMNKVFWKTGRYRDRSFTAEKEGVVDFGAYYAAKTMLDKDGNRILWGWIPETRPQAEYRAAGWAGLMSLPRGLSLASDGSLEMSVAPAVQMLRAEHAGCDLSGDRSSRAKALTALQIPDLAAELQAEFAPQCGFQLRLRTEDGQPFAEIAYDPGRTGAELRVNATRAALRTNTPVSLRVFLDGSALEVFANQTAVITTRIYTVLKGPLRLEVSDPAVLRSLDLWPMKPISNDRLTS